METVIGKIRAITLHRRPRLILRRSAKYPADVSPIGAEPRAVRIFFGFGKRVVDAVSCHPAQRPRLDRERSDRAQSIFNPFGSFEPTMREKTMIADADP